MTRAFVGIGVPDEVSAVLETAQTGLRQGNLVPFENFHVTLAFLGEQPDLVLAEVHDALSALDLPAQDLAIRGLGTFGDRRPRALFAEVVPTPGLTALRRKVRQTARAFGVDLGHERFHPHVTLARFGSGLSEEQVPELQAHIARRMGRVAGAWRAEAFHLFESRLLAHGPVYDVLAEYPLGGVV